MMLVDTNIFVDHLRGHPPATEFFLNTNQKDILFSAITETELLAGTDNNIAQKREQLLGLLHQYRKIVVNNPVAQLAGDITRSHGLSVPDAIIAATTLKTRATLVTRNTKDFKHVPGLQIKTPY